MRLLETSARRWRLALSLLAAGLIFSVPPVLAQRPNQLWVKLILAENGGSAAARLVPGNLQARLHDVFGYRAYALLQAQGVNLNQALDALGGTASRFLYCDYPATRNCMKGRRRLITRFIPKVSPSPGAITWRSATAPFSWPDRTSTRGSWSLCWSLSSRPSHLKKLK